MPSLPQGPPPGVTPGQLESAMTGVLPDRGRPPSPGPDPRAGGPMLNYEIPIAEKPPAPFPGSVGQFYDAQMNYARSSGQLGNRGVAQYGRRDRDMPAFTFDEESGQWVPHQSVKGMIGRFK